MQQSRLLKMKEVLTRCAMSRSTLYRLIEAKRFPYQVSVTGNRSVAWHEEDIQRWIEERPSRNK